MTEGQPPGGGDAEERADLTGLSRLSDRPPPPRGERAVRVIRALSVLLLAIAAAGLPWYFLTRTNPSVTVQPPPTATASPSPTSTASPTPVSATYEVADVGVCLRIREEPGRNQPVLDCVNAGVRLKSDGQTREADGLLWRRVFDRFKKSWGWAADQYLKPVA